MDKTLILDCSAGMSVYVADGGKVFSSVENDQKKHTDNLLLVVDELLKKANMKAGDIKNFCVCVGPGSFTGIRVAVSVCKGICISKGADVYTCSNFDIFSFGEKEPSVFVLEAFSNYLYIRRFDGKNNVDSCETIEEFKTSLYDGERVFACSEKVQNLLKNAEIQSNIAQNCILNVFEQKIKNCETTKLSDISPVYLRLSQAEIEREKKLKENSNG